MVRSNSTSHEAANSRLNLARHEDILLCRGSIVLVAFAIQTHNDPPLALVLLVAAIIIGAIGFLRI
jgi:hypothetical protein